MSICVHEDDIAKIDEAGHAGADLIGADNGATNGFSLGVAVYYLEAYGEPGVHDDQEGFYVVEGTGKARIGDEEFDADELRLPSLDIQWEPCFLGSIRSLCRTG